MTGGAVLRAATAGAARRLVPTVVIFCVLAAGSAAALLGLTLVTNSNELFLTAFARSRGAQLAVTADSAKATAAQLAATRQLPGVTQAAGPYPQTFLKLTSGQAAGRPPGFRAADPAGPGEPSTGDTGHVAGRGRPPVAVRPAG
jgi:putative ABC transport system permease protein